MKFLHLADLHLGKVLNHFNLLEDQKYILEEILRKAEMIRPAAVLIAGDLYDSPTPGTEAIKLCDEFLMRLVALPCRVLIISGNHDSQERLSFLSRLLQKQGVFISKGRLDELSPVTLKDEHGEVNFYLLPFLKPSEVRRFFPEAKLESYTDAVRTVINSLKLDPNARNVLLSHQFVTGAIRSDSELSVGGSDNVDAQVYAPFDYVALGHLHRPQQVDSPQIRYSGSPLKYSFSEANHQKTLCVVSLEEKGKCYCEELPVQPRHDLIEFKSSFSELVRMAEEHRLNPDDYYRFCLSDEQEIPEVISKLRYFYPHLMQIYYEKLETRLEDFCPETEQLSLQTPYEQLTEFFRLQQQKELDAEQQQICQELFAELWEE